MIDIYSSFSLHTLPELSDEQISRLLSNSIQFNHYLMSEIQGRNIRIPEGVFIPKFLPIFEPDKNFAKAVCSVLTDEQLLNAKNDFGLPEANVELMIRKHR